MRQRLARLAVCGLVLAGTLLTGCQQVRYNQQERLRTHAMQFDADHVQAEMRGHILPPREGALGGFAAVGAGGCGCN